MRDALLLFYCAAVGFVAAGIAASFYKMVTTEPARFKLLGKGWLAAATTFIFCALTGPAIIIDLVLKTRLSERGGPVMLLGGLVIAAVWSICSGILVLELVLSVGGRLA